MKQCYWNLAGFCTLRNIPDDTHFDVAMAACSIPVPSSLKSNITICSCTGQNIQLKMLKSRPNECGTACFLNKIRNFVFSSIANGKMRRIQTLWNDNKDVMLDCDCGFHQSEDKRKLSCHKLRSSYVTSILITNWVHYPLIFFCLSVSLVLSLLCVYYIRMLWRQVCFVSNNVVRGGRGQGSAMYGYPMYTTKVWRISVVCTTNWCCKGNKIQISLHDVCLSL